ncbi:beta-lactamase/transpeptidase-like protein [Clohesyomyces aquaticus]|uniref:Beta-lactamase/transpeptidase-like protein n=1 Tax=Clohesyomyces aquaticus TaxID=1231657 RepID=A0A1Y2A805_9PLEO|nr:beta-lactamase/transpeptidase-like protein [Clohesyomyces aquaticus]
MSLNRGYLAILISAIFISCSAQDIPFTPCPLLGPRFPIPKSTAMSPIIREGLQNLTNTLDLYLRASDGKYGPVTPNTTSFSLALFSTDDSNSTTPFFYQYHHTAPSLSNSSEGVRKIDGDSVYRVGDVTTMFTTWLFLIEAGEAYWDDPVSKWLPQLAAAAQLVEPLERVHWDQITLGDLAAHLGGIGSYAPGSQRPLNSNIPSLFYGAAEPGNPSPCSNGSSLCGRSEFLSYFGRRPAVFSAGSTPIFSNAGFIILAMALENIKGKSFDEMTSSSILSPLNMSSTNILEPPTSGHGVIPANTSDAEWSNPVQIEAAFNGMYSTVSDISAALRAILSSDLLEAPVTNRWLKPLSLTSNRANSVGRPWEIFSLSETPISYVIPVYQVRGNVGLYSSHVGLVADYGVGFAILAADSDANPDLNAHADIVAEMLIPALEKNAIAQASAMLAGTYKSGNNSTKSVLTIAPAVDSSPGLSITSFTSGNTDIRAAYAKLNNIKSNKLSFRVYPTGLTEITASGERMVFRAVFQNISALADAGTPTCETWRYFDRLQVQGVPLDEFIFDIRDGKAVSIEVKGMGLKLRRS